MTPTSFWSQEKRYAYSVYSLQFNSDKLAGINEYFENEQRVIERSGGKIVGYFLPTDFAGPTDEAIGLIDLPSLAAYETYRQALADDPDHKRNIARLEQKRCRRGDEPVVYPARGGGMISALTGAAKLDPREEHFRVPGPHDGLSLFLRYLPPSRDIAADGRTVVFVHGGTFPSALSIAHRFDGRSWRDELCEVGFHVWGLDFHGFGLSDSYPEMAMPAERHPPLGRAADCSRQLEQAIRFIGRRQGMSRVSMIAHSWGTIVAGDLAARCPELVDRLVFFGPIARRVPRASGSVCPAGG